jgi:hypothetical protein
VRLPDWEARLSAYIAERAEMPFQWGVNDCALFAAGAVQALTGEDFGKPWRGKYSTEAGAAKALKRRGFEDVAGPFTQALGDPFAAAFARRGDIVSDGTNLGVMWVGGALFAAEAGLVRALAADLGQCWRVG